MGSSRDGLYKVKYGCLHCGRTRETQWKPDPELPARCHKTCDGTGCGRSQSNLSLHKIWEQGTYGEKNLIVDKTGKNSKGDDHWY